MRSKPFLNRAAPNRSQSHSGRPKAVSPPVTINWTIEDQHVVLTIDDTGAGLLNRQQRLRAVLYTKPEGSGIGLALSRSELSKRIRVPSNSPTEMAGDGCRCRVTLAAHLTLGDRCPIPPLFIRGHHPLKRTSHSNRFSIMARKPFHFSERTVVATTGASSSADPFQRVVSANEQRWIRTSVSEGQVRGRVTRTWQPSRPFRLGEFDGP